MRALQPCLALSQGDNGGSHLLGAQNPIQSGQQMTAGGASEAAGRIGLRLLEEGSLLMLGQRPS